MSKTLALLPALLLAATAATGCAAARVRTDPALEAVRPVDVTGANPRRWGAPVRFGAWSTGPVSGADTLGWSLAVLGAGVSSTQRPYAWTSSGPTGAVEAECHQRGLELFTRAGAAGDTAGAGFTFDLAGATGRPALACAFRTAPGAAPATLALRATGRPEPAFVGELRAGGVSYAVRSVHALEGTPVPLGTPAGFALEQGGHVVAMVETMNAGRVWLPAASPDEGALAAAATALLLFQPEG